MGKGYPWFGRHSLLQHPGRATMITLSSPSKTPFFCCYHVLLTFLQSQAKNFYVLYIFPPLSIRKLWIPLLSPATKGKGFTGHSSAHPPSHATSTRLYLEDQRIGLPHRTVPRPFHEGLLEQTDGAIPVASPGFHQRPSLHDEGVGGLLLEPCPEQLSGEFKVILLRLQHAPRLFEAWNTRTPPQRKKTYILLLDISKKKIVAS